MTKKERLTIKLSPLEKTAVHTPTQEEYDTLMQVYECGEWRWSSNNPPTELNRWAVFKENTCINTNINRQYSSLNYYKQKKAVIILPQQFYKVQGITKEALEEIKKCFEENK